MPVLFNPGSLYVCTTNSSKLDSNNYFLVSMEVMFDNKVIQHSNYMIQKGENAAKFVLKRYYIEIMKNLSLFDIYPEFFDFSSPEYRCVIGKDMWNIFVKDIPDIGSFVFYLTEVTLCH